MGWVQLVLLASLQSYFTWSSLTPGVSGFSVKDDTVETTFRQLCNGVEVELKNCNLRLAEKTEYTTSVEKEVFLLKRQLRQVKITCTDAAQAASVQISALQSQLDSLLRQLGDAASGPATEVLEIMQKYIYIKNMEMDITTTTDTTKISQLEEKLKVLKAELEKKTAGLKEAKCPAGDSSHAVEVSRLQEEIDKLRSGSGSTADSRRLTELKKALENTLKKLDGSGDGFSAQVTAIMEGNEDVLDIQRRLAALLKTEAEFTAIVERLKVKKTLLSDLKEEKEEKGLNPTLSKRITVVEKEVWALEDELEIRNQTLSRRDGLEKQLLKKKEQVEGKLDALKNNNQELFSRLLSVQLKLQETQIHWMGEKTAAEVLTADLQKQLEEKEDKASQLLAKNVYLEKKLADITSECDDLQIKFNELSDQLDGIMGKLPETNLKHILEIAALNMDIDSIRESISKETLLDKIEELKKLLKAKIDELNLKKNDLKKNDPSALKIFVIMEKTKEIQLLQSTIVNMDDLDTISNQQKELIRLIDDLDDSNLAKLVLKNMVMLSDETWLKKLIVKITQRSQKQLTDLEQQLKDTEETLKLKLAELVKKGSNVDQLTRDIVALKDDVKNLKEEISWVKVSSSSQVAELEKKLAKTKQDLDNGNRSLMEKDTELAKNVAKITQLIEELRQTKLKAQENDEEAAAKITELEERVKKSEKEKDRVTLENRKLQEDLKEARKCTEVHESYTDLQKKFDKEVLKLSDNFARQVLTIKTLSVEVSVLKQKLSLAEGNTDALEEELKKKNGALEKMMKELEKERVDSAELLKLLDSMKKVVKQQDQSIAEYLAEIEALDKDMEALMAKAGSKGEKTAQLTIQVMVLKEEIAKLEKLQSDLKQEAVKKTERLEKEIEETKKEINFLKRSGCETDQTKKQLDLLQVKLKAKEREMDNLKKNTEAELVQLEDRLAEKAKKLESSGNELMEKDKQNAELIQQLIDLGQRLKEATSDQNLIRENSEKQINDLKKQLKTKEDEVLKLKNSIKNLKEQMKDHEKNVSQLKTDKAALDSELAEKKKELTKAEQELKEKEVAIAKVEKELQTKEEEIKKAMGGCKDIKEKLKNKEDEVTKLKISNTDTLKQNEKLKTQITETDTKLQALQDLKLENEEVQKELDECKVKVESSKANVFTVVSPEWDPDTAHRQLLLTGKGKAVKASEFARFVPNNPERFDTVLAAVAKTGYESGKPYWEIDVDIRACFVVGVAKQSAKRKGTLTYGPKHGYWGIVRKKNGQYHALNDKTIPLKLPANPAVIGVLLDFTKGDIVFYNAKTKKPIYTYHDNKFNEKLFPYIETCKDQDKNEPPIVISDSDSVLWEESS